MTSYFEPIQNIELDPLQGGYSDIRLWPCYMGYTGLILFLTPILGTFISILIVTVPALMIAHKVAQVRQSDSAKAAKAWKEINDLYDAYDRGETFLTAQHVRNKSVKHEQVNTKSDSYFSTAVNLA